MYSKRKSSEVTQFILKIIILFILLIIATIKDVKMYQVPNTIIALGLISGLICNLINFGMEGITVWCLGIITPLILLIVFFALRMIGAGDVKLFMVIGGFIGYILVLKSIFIALILGAIMSVIKIYKNKNFFIRMKYLKEYLFNIIKTKKIKVYYNLKKDGYQSVIPFTVAITGGVFLTILNEYFKIYFY